MATLNSYAPLTFSNPSAMNYEIAKQARDAGWEVKSVPAFSEIYTFFNSWPTPFVPITAFGISKDGGGSGELLTPPDFPLYTPPPGYGRRDMPGPIQGVQYLPSFLGTILDWGVSYIQNVPLGVYGILVSWVPSSAGSEDFYEVTRPTEAQWVATVVIGASLGIQMTKPRYGGYILKSPMENGTSMYFWLDNNSDTSMFVDAIESQFYVSHSELLPVPHPRSDAGYPSDSSAILVYQRCTEGFDLYVNSKNLWLMTNTGTAQFHWYVSNLYPQGNVSNAMLLFGEAVPCGPRFMSEAPVWWMYLNDVTYIRPAFTGNAQIGRLHSVAGDTVQLTWDDPTNTIECVEFLVFVRDSATGASQFIGLAENVLVGHSTYTSGATVPFDGDTFYKLSSTNGAGVLVLV